MIECSLMEMKTHAGYLEINQKKKKYGLYSGCCYYGIKGFGKLLDHAAESSALKRNVSIKEVGNAAAFLCSDLASGITGEVTYVDAGYNF